MKNVVITNGPYNEPGGAYMFYGTDSSYIEFPNKGGLDSRFSVSLMCWVQPGGQDGPILSYEVYRGRAGMGIEYGKFFHKCFQLPYPIQLETAEVLPTGKWVHVAATYDHNTGNNSLYINGHLRASQNIDRGYTNQITSRTIRMGSSSKPYRRDHFKGKIAEMKVYDVALNEEQIQASIRQGS